MKDKKISYIFGGKNKIKFETVFNKLKQLFNINKLLLEGGGYINGEVIKEDLIDEISLMVLPFVVNNIEAPELFYSNPLTAKTHQFKLIDVTKLKRDIVLLKYLKK